MALSNVFREPRRELTEQAVGAIVAGLAVSAWTAGAWTFATWVSPSDPTVPWGGWLFIGFLLVPFAIMAVTLAVFLIHEAGEGICDALEDRGIHLRPRNRPANQPE